MSIYVDNREILDSDLRMDVVNSIKEKMKSDILNNFYLNPVLGI